MLITMIGMMFAIAQDHPIAEPVDLPSWLSMSDYPTEARTNGQSGSVRVNIDVDETGKVQRCLVTRSSGHDALDEGTCRLVSDKGKFVPATDSAGKMVAGRFTWSMQWAMPETLILPRMSWEEKALIRFSEDREIESCEGDGDDELPAGMTLCLYFHRASNLAEGQPIFRAIGKNSVIDARKQIIFRDDNPQAMPLFLTPVTGYISYGTAKIEITDDGSIANCLVEDGGIRPKLFDLCAAAASFRFEPAKQPTGYRQAIYLQSIAVPK